MVTGVVVPAADGQEHRTEVVAVDHTIKEVWKKTMVPIDLHTLPMFLKIIKITTSTQE